MMISPTYCFSVKIQGFSFNRFILTLLELKIKFRGRGGGGGGSGKTHKER